MTNDELAATFVESLAGPDVDALRAVVAPHARFWVNVGPTSFSRDERFALLEAERSHLRELEFEDVHVQPTMEGFVVQLTTVATTTAGVDLRIPVCLVVAADDGVIASVEEYADSAPAAPLLELMSGGTR